MTVHIAPASEEDARVIAALLESGICPWPGYQVIALTGQPWVYVLSAQAAGVLLARLYEGQLASFSAQDEDGFAVPVPVAEQPPAAQQPEPEPEPQPASEPQPAPEPQPASEPEPASTPEPQPAPEPEPVRTRAKAKPKSGSTQTNVK